MRPKNSPIGATGADQIGDRQQIELVAAAEQPDRDHHAEQPAMERHAAFPGRDELMGLVTKAIGRPRQKSASGETLHRMRAVDQVPAQPPAEDDAERRPDHQVADLVFGGGRLAVEGRSRSTASCGASMRTDAPPAQQQAGDIGQRVPADRQRPQICSSTGSIWGKGRAARIMRRLNRGASRLVSSRLAAASAPYKAAGDSHGTDRQSLPRRHGQGLHRRRRRGPERAGRNRHLREAAAGAAGGRHGFRAARGVRGGQGDGRQGPRRE